MIDLRSDTVTKPTPQMLEAMCNASVGDDVFQEDPTIIQLEETAARMFGKEAGLFCPSGTMTNQIAIKALTGHGTEVICEKGSHVYYYEGGGIMSNSGASVKLIEGNRGRITADDVIKNINADNVHFPESRLVVLENTANRGGGSCYGLDDMQNIAATCKTHNLFLHLDGARIFNACIAKNYTTAQVGNCFHSISVCLSKGLGAPVGSVLLADKQMIHKARRIRKVFGGGMRQAGYIAAAGLYALQNHVNRLADDHQKAKQIEAVLKTCSYVKNILPVETNILIFELNDGIKTETILNHLTANNILAFATGPNTIRFVTHLDITDNMMAGIEKVLKTFN